MGDALTEFLNEFLFVQGAWQHGRAEDFKSVLAALLGLAHGKHRVAQQARPIEPAVSKHRHAARNAELIADTVQTARVADVLLQALEQLAHLGMIARAAQHEELVAVKTVQVGALWQEWLQFLNDRAQHHIAECMRVQHIDAGEIVDVKEQNAALLRLSVRDQRLDHPAAAVTRVQTGHAIDLAVLLEILQNADDVSGLVHTGRLVDASACTHPEIPS